jgi:predicted nucleotidyltransferase
MKTINLPSIVTFLSDRIPDLQAVYVYGSFLMEHFGDGSDLDLAFRAENELDNVERWIIQQALAEMIRRDTDLLDLNRASIVMQFEVITTGKRLFCLDEEAIARYETLVYSRYLDFNQVRKPIIESIQQRGSIYGD